MTADPLFTEINITPLTDIFLLLLIIFMVSSASIHKHSSVDVKLPEVSSDHSQTSSEGIVLTLLPNRKIKVAQKELSLGQWTEIEKLIKTELSKSSSKFVVLEGDQQSFLGSAIEVMDHARRAGAKKFGIATQTSVHSQVKESHPAPKEK